MEAFGEADGSIELEAKRKEDSSWHPCRVSLSSSGDSLNVNFGTQELEDMLLKKEEVLMHLRFRSMPLQADDCCLIEVGERVLANRKSQFKDLFHDAEVLKVDRIRHSKRGCRCTFLIKWLDHDLEEQTLSVPASSIMRLATKSISAHPIVHTLLKPEKDTGLSSSPLSTILEGIDAEMDLNELLQKQVEHISNLADASEKDFPDDILWRNKVLNKGQTPHKPTAETNTCVPAIPDHHNHLKRTTRSERKLQVGIEAIDQTGPATSMQKEFIQNRSHLSPLASRAALASSLLIAKCLDVDFSSCMTANMIMKDNRSSEVVSVSIPLVSEASHVTSPLISTQGSASFKVSCCVPTKIRENENKFPEDRAFDPAKVTAENATSEVANSGAETMTSSKLAIPRDKRYKKTSAVANFNPSSAAPIRLTRSAIRKGTLIPNDSIELKICTDEKEKRVSGNKNRLSPSAVCQENENLGNEEGNNCNAEDRAFDTAKVTAEIATSEVANSSAETMTCKLAIPRDKKSSALANFNASSTAPIRLTRSAIRKGALIPNDSIEVKICTDAEKGRMSGNKNRLTHSAVCQENGNLGNEEGNNSTNIMNSDSSKGSTGIHESNVATVKSSTSKKTEVAFTPCNDADDARSNQGQKRKAVYPSKQDQKFSPRNFLPRTRSQNKSQPGKHGGTISY